MLGLSFNPNFACFKSSLNLCCSQVISLLHKKYLVSKLNVIYRYRSLLVKIKFVALYTHHPFQVLTYKKENVLTR